MRGAEVFFAIATLILTAALVGVTWSYAKTTRDISRQNSQLVAATRHMANETAKMAKVSADALFLQAVPIIQLEGAGGAFSSGGENRVQPMWRNVGQGLALEASFAYEIVIDSEADTRPRIGRANL